MNEFYGSPSDLIGEAGPDTWMEGDIVILNKNEFNKNLYEFGLSINKIKVQI